MSHIIRCSRLKRSPRSIFIVWLEGRDRRRGRGETADWTGVPQPSLSLEKHNVLFKTNNPPHLVRVTAVELETRQRKRGGPRGGLRGELPAMTDVPTVMSPTVCPSALREMPEIPRCAPRHASEGPSRGTGCSVEAGPGCRRALRVGPSRSVTYQPDLLLVSSARTSYLSACPSAECQSICLLRRWKGGSSFWVSWPARQRRPRKETELNAPRPRLDPA